MSEISPYAPPNTWTEKESHRKMVGLQNSEYICYGTCLVAALHLLGARIDADTYTAVGEMMVFGKMAGSYEKKRKQLLEERVSEGEGREDVVAQVNADRSNIAKLTFKGATVSTGIMALSNFIQESFTDKNSDMIQGYASSAMMLLCVLVSYAIKNNSPELNTSQGRG